MNTYQIVNQNGIKEIQEILSKHHKLGGDHFTTDMLWAWAETVDNSLAEGNGPRFEIKSYDTVSGHTERFELSAESLDTREVDE